MDVTVVVGTFGDERWVNLAQTRAIPSAKALGVPVVHVHGRSLHEARNAAIKRVRTEFLCALDADDELEPGFFQGIEAAGHADVRAPSVRYVSDRGHRPVFGEQPGQAVMPRVWGHSHQCEGACLAFGNWIVIGAVARTQVLRDVGGFRDWDVFEDWDCWVRCWLAGATFLAAPGAVYRAHASPNSRNRSGSPESRMDAHRAIARDLGLPVPL